MRLHLVSSFVFLSLLAGCEASNDKAAIALLETKIAELEKLTARVTKLEKDLVKLHIDTFVKGMEGPQESATFDPQDEKAYTAVKAPAGPMLVVLEKLEPYLDGFTVSMRIGNPTSAGFSGVKGKVSWGRKFDLKMGDEHNKLSEKELDLRDLLPAGNWTVVKFNIAPATAEEVRRIVFAPIFDEVRLRQPAK